MRYEPENSPGRMAWSGGERELSMRERYGCEDVQVQKGERSLLQAL